MMSEILQLLTPIIDENQILTAPEDLAPYVTPWRGEPAGHALAVVFPHTTQQVSALAALCHQQYIPLVPQGGNTGLVRGSTPDISGQSIIINLSHMRKIDTPDIINHTCIVEAGCILSTYKERLAEDNMFFPLSMASEASACMGGIVSTNAGGTAVLKYGTMRELVLGVEMVLADGTIINELQGLRKNNTGYKLSQLAIGAEGTLGIITRICTKIVPYPTYKETALVALSSLEAVKDLYMHIQQHAGETLSAFELVPRLGIELVTKHVPHARNPHTSYYDYAALVELSTASAHIDLRHIIEYCLTSNTITDGVIAETEEQRANLWALREYISEAEKQEHTVLAFDVSVNIADFPSFITTAHNACKQIYPDIQLVAFGHVGDGNIHFNLLLPKDNQLLEQMGAPLKEAVYQTVQSMQGSFSAEHGVGRDKQDIFYAHTSPERIKVMQQLKHMFDPHHIMNPGVLLHE